MIFETKHEIQAVVTTHPVVADVAKGHGSLKGKTDYDGYGPVRKMYLDWCLLLAS